MFSEFVSSCKWDEKFILGDNIIPIEFCGFPSDYTICRTSFRKEQIWIKQLNYSRAPRGFMCYTSPNQARAVWGVVGCPISCIQITLPNQHPSKAQKDWKGHSISKDTKNVLSWNIFSVNAGVYLVNQEGEKGHFQHCQDIAAGLVGYKSSQCRFQMKEVFQCVRSFVMLTGEQFTPLSLQYITIQLGKLGAHHHDKMAERGRWTHNRLTEWMQINNLDPL